MDNVLLCVYGGHILTLIKILFLGASVQVTATPIDIEKSPLTFDIPKGLNVVTTGAHLLVDISENVNVSNLLEARKSATLKYSKGCVKVQMITEDNKEFIFSNQSVLWSKGKVLLSFNSTNKLTTDLIFTKVVIQSCHSIQGAKIVWVNYKH